jgi:lysophospholipase L1-like esterase
MTRPALGNPALAALSVGLLLVGLGPCSAWPGRQERARRRPSTAIRSTIPSWAGRRVWRAGHNRREYRVEIAINGRGLRDRERAYAASPGGFRVLALGDSFVEGYSVPLEATVSQVLERSLAEPGCPVEVINGGTSAYSTDQEYLFYREEGYRYGPQVVALFFYYNDVVYNDRRVVLRKPCRASFKGPRPEPRREVQEPEPEEERPVEPEPPPSGSALFAWVRDRLMRGAPRAYAALARVGIWAPVRVVPPRIEMKVYKRKPTPEIETGWEATRRILEALRDEVATHGARLMVVYVPSRMEVSDGDWELTRIRYGMDEKWERGLVRERLQAMLGETGIPLLDLTLALQGEERGLRGGPYYRYDGHWNALGHRVAARELEAFLLRQQLLPACASEAP